jgi:hypothetical protein
VLDPQLAYVRSDFGGEKSEHKRARGLAVYVYEPLATSGREAGTCRQASSVKMAATEAVTVTTEGEKLNANSR